MEIEMTRRRYDKCSTEFGLWLRDQPEIDSGLGFVATNIDYVWLYRKTGKWMLIEEKRYERLMTYAQGAAFKVVDACAKSDENYMGFHFLRFERTSPEDGWMKLDGKLINKQDLIEFLRFEKPKEWYVGIRL